MYFYSSPLFTIQLFSNTTPTCYSVCLCVLLFPLSFSLVSLFSAFIFFCPHSYISSLLIHQPMLLFYPESYIRTKNTTLSISIFTYCTIIYAILFPWPCLVVWCGGGGVDFQKLKQTCTLQRLVWFWSIHRLYTHQTIHSIRKK